MTSRPLTAKTARAMFPSPKAQLPATSDFPTWRRCQFEELVRQLPPFTRNSGLLPARGKHKQYTLGDRTVRFASALIWIVAALLIACSSDSTLPAPQVGNETSTDARPSLDFVHLGGVGEDVCELSVNCGWGFSAVGFPPRQCNISVGQPQHEVRRFRYVSNFCTKSSFGGSDRTAHSDAHRRNDTGSVHPAGYHRTCRTSGDDRSTRGPARNENGANRHTAGADGDCATNGDPDRHRDSSTRDRVSSPSHAAGLRPP